MSEKRFSYLTGAMGVLFYDGDEMMPYPKVCEILNKVDEQQAIIKEQNEAIEYLKTVIRYTLPNQMVADVFKEIGEEYE